MQALKDAVATGDLIRVGVYLHIFQDTYAHAGCSANWGGWGHAFRGTTPDYSSIHPKRMEEMAKTCYKILNSPVLKGSISPTGTEIQLWDHISNIAINTWYEDWLPFTSSSPEWISLIYGEYPDYFSGSWWGTNWSADFTKAIDMPSWYNYDKSAHSVLGGLFSPVSFTIDRVTDFFY